MQVFTTSDSPADINLPITAVALVLVIGFLKVPAPKGSIGHKLKQLDWMLVAVFPPETSLTHLRTAETSSSL